MKLALFPPLGWIAALASAGLTGLWLQSPALPIAGPELPAGETAAGKTASVPLPPLTDAAAALQAFAIRPLLAEGRRPFTPATAPEPAAAPEVPLVAVDPVPEVASAPPSLVMLGAMELEGRRRALLRDQTTGAEKWYSIGDVIAGWTVVTIQPERINLQLQGVEITFKLFE